jgi:hypothetical protein
MIDGQKMALLFKVGRAFLGVIDVGVAIAPDKNV